MLVNNTFSFANKCIHNTNNSIKSYTFAPAYKRKDARVAEEARLESV